MYIRRCSRRGFYEHQNTQRRARIEEPEGKGDEMGAETGKMFKKAM
jgi:hypothetical protein